MGRWKRNKQKYANSRSTSGASTSSNSSRGGAQGKPFTHRDRKVLLYYLQDYHAGASNVYNGKPVQRNRAGIDKSTFIGGHAFPKPIVIGGHTFPLLTDEVLREPYLALPKELWSKQRRIVHEMCSDIGLFHCGVGPSRDDRVIVVSIYRDGLSRVPGIAGNPTIPFRTYKPWACRKEHNKPLQITKKAREAIYQFIDQPGACLRDGIDSIDFESVENDDLSKTTPPGFEEGEWMLVDSPEKMRQCVRELQESKPTEIAFDLECHNRSNYAQMTCLIQLAANSGKEYVIDPLAPEVWESVHLLAPLFADPQIVKIGHSIGGLDVRCLHRDFGIFVINAFDTYEAAQSLRLRNHGLANVCAYYGLPDCDIYVRLKAEYQTSDWTKRPLSQPMIQYGRYDVHYLIRLRKLMMRDLAKQELWDIGDQTIKDAEARQVAASLAAMLTNFDEDEEIFTDDFDRTEVSTPAEASVVYNKDAPCEEDPTQDGGERQSFFDAHELRMNIDLMQAVSRSQDRCLDLWNDSAEPRLKNSEFQSLLTRCKKEEKDWTTSQLELYERLARWREEIAAKEECTGGFVCSLGFLASVALKRPTSEIGLRHLNFHLPEVFEETSDNDYVNELFQIVSESLGADGLEEYDYSAIPSYDEFLERERTGRFSNRSLTLESAGIIRVMVAAGLVACVATAVAMATARGRRMQR